MFQPCSSHAEPKFLVCKAIFPHDFPLTLCGCSFAMFCNMVTLRLSFILSPFSISIVSTKKVVTCKEISSPWKKLRRSARLKSKRTQNLTNKIKLSNRFETKGAVSQ